MVRRAVVLVLAAVIALLVPGIAHAGAPAGVGPGAEQPPETFAPTLHVPADYPTIQEAIDPVQPGGMVLIAPGV